MPAAHSQSKKIIKTNSSQNFLAAIQSLENTINALQSTIKGLESTIQDLRSENRELKKMLFGQRSERQRKSPAKMPSVAEALAQSISQPDTDKDSIKKRPKTGGRQKKNKASALQEMHRSHAPTACSHCQSENLTNTGVEDISEEIEFVPARFIRIVHHRERKRCLDCDQIVHAKPPVRVSPSTAYGVGLHAHVVLSKCADSMPIHRLSQSFERVGVDIHRSTLNDIFHRTADCFVPIHTRLLQLVGQASHVNADETTIRVQTPEKCKKSYVWTFLSDTIVAYVFASGRSGETPRRILGNSTGKLQVDAYSGYNSVCMPEKRERAACLAHVRRKFWEALDGGDESARQPIDQILKIYSLEYDAAEQDILGSDEHGVLRSTQGRLLLIELFVMCRRLRDRSPPGSRLGQAVRYALNNWRALLVIMRDPKIRLDNNIAEGALRIIALGRKNFLFVGNHEAGYNLAVLQTIVSTCKANGVNAFDYMVAVLPKMASIDPKNTAQIDALLPMRWAKSAE